jgi:cell division protein FtsQ
MWDDHLLLNRIATALLAAAGLALGYAALLALVRLPLFAVREVVVTTPAVHTTREQVHTLVHGELRGNFFTLDLERSRAAFEKLPWVRRASLRRAWPDQVEVALEEHIALARWRDTALVNTHGELFEAATDQSLPVFAGPTGASAEMAEHYRRFGAALAPLSRRPLEVRLSERRAWQVKLDDGTTLDLGRQDVAARVERFVSAYRQAQGQLPSGVYRVDLRYPSGFAVRVPGLRANQRAG